ncbi:hypothetical protein LSAT2_013651 [Lamellibrachia satsuma]|nr:hypothetical protein LSAT2_013651 [Lamellibrachia satsuma]
MTKLRAQARFDAKWIKTDIRDAFTRDGLSRLWNELVKDGEVATSCNDGIVNSAGVFSKKVQGSSQRKVSCNDGIVNSARVFSKKGENGRYHCGMRVLTCSCCDGFCGPDGCTCAPCQQLDEEERQQELADADRPISSAVLMDGWTWAPPPNEPRLKECLQSIISEQQKLVREAAGTTLSVVRLQQRIVVLERYFIALSRLSPIEGKSPTRKKQNLQANLNKQKSSAMRPTTEKATLGLARVGSRAALSFAFAFLRRAWRSGEDSDLCSDLLHESLDALRSLPEGTLFDESSMSSVWLEVVERSFKFLRSIVEGDISTSAPTKVNHVPLVDQQTALALLLELAVQRGSLSHILQVVLLLLKLWRSSRHQHDNRFTSNLTCAPLAPLLRRFEQIEGLKKTHESYRWEEHMGCCLVSPTECFLRYLNVPEDDLSPVDLRQCAVVIMSHLDRLSQPYLPPADGQKTHTSSQEVLCWGWLAWRGGATSMEASVVDTLIDVGGVQQVVCAESCFLVLTRTNKVYRIAYSSPTQSMQLVTGFGDKEVTKLAAHPEGKHFLALSADGDVYSWGNGDGGRLGHGDNNSYEVPTLVMTLSGKQTTTITCGSTYSAAITSLGELYTWGRGSYGRLGHGGSDDQMIPTPVLALKGQRVIDVACGSGDAQTLAVTQSGAVYSWGDGDYGKLGRGGSDGCKTPKVIEKLQGKEVTRVFCGSQFSLALTKTGALYTWGKGDNHRLGFHERGPCPPPQAG